jgi:hypothetical protein
MPVWDIPYADEIPPGFLTATIINAPSSPSSALFVQIPSLPGNNRVKANWEPHGGTYPSAGAPCLVCFDESGGCWVLQWVGGWS